MVINQKNTAIKCYATYNLCLNFKHYKNNHGQLFNGKKKSVINPGNFRPITDHFNKNNKIIF